MKSTKNCDQSLHFISPLSRDLFMRVLDDSQNIWRYYFFHDDNCPFDVDAPNFELVPSTLNLVYDSFVRLMASSSLNSCPTPTPTNLAANVVSSSSSAAVTAITDNVAPVSTVTDTEVGHTVDDTLNLITATTTGADINDPYQLCFNYDIVRLLHDKFIDSDKSGDKTMINRVVSRTSDDCATPTVHGAAASRDSDVLAPSRSIVVSSSYVVTPQRLCDSLGRHYGFVETKVKYLSTTFLHEYIVYTNVLEDFYTPDTPVRLSSDSMGSMFLSSYSNQQYPTTLPLINPFLENPDCERHDSTDGDDVSVRGSNRDTDISRLNDDCFRSQRPLVALKMLNLFQTLYRFRLDARLTDHSNHYDESFVPFFRFPYDTSSVPSNSTTTSRPFTYNRLNALSFASMSRFVGGTMRKNIRLLYDYIWEILGSSESREFCPCVIIYNIFIRDYFRIFHSRSLSPTNYVLLYDDFADVTDFKKIRKISYVQLSNKFPRVSQWFRSINNQFVKKNGFSRIFKLSDYVELFETALDLSLDNFVNACTVVKNTEDSARAKSPRRSQRRKNANGGGRCRRRLSSSSSSSSLAPLSTCRPKKTPVDGRKSVVKKIGIKNFSVINALNNARRKIGVCNMMRKIDCQAMLSELYRSGYKICPHAKTRRVYIQKRSHDESASAVIFCENCKNFL